MPMLPMICVACRTMEWDIYQLARRYKIHCIVNGANPFQNTSFIKELLHIPDNTKFHHAIIKSAPCVLKEIIRNPRYLYPKYIPQTIKSYLMALINTVGPRYFGFDFSIIGFFYFIEWNQQKVLSRIQSELNWDYPVETGSSQRFDCPFAHIKDYFYLKYFGITKNDDYFSKMIREGFITRKEALEVIEKEHESILCEGPVLLEKLLTGRDSKSTV